MRGKNKLHYVTVIAYGGIWLIKGNMIWQFYSSFSHYCAQSFDTIMGLLEIEFNPNILVSPFTLQMCQINDQKKTS